MSLEMAEQAMSLLTDRKDELFPNGESMREDYFELRFKWGAR